MNNTESNKKVDFSSIRELQNIIKANEFSNFAAGLKSFRQKLSDVEGKISALKKTADAQKQTEQKAEPVKTQTVQPSVQAEQKQAVAKEQSSEVKTQMQKPQMSGNRPNQNQNPNQINKGFDRNQNGRGNFAGQNQNNFRRNPDGRPSGGRFTPTGERRFDNANGGGERRQNFYNSGQNFGGGFGQNGAGANAAGQRKPFVNRGPAGAGGFMPRAARPQETFDASSLVKNNNRSNNNKKKPVFERNDEKKTNTKKALIMRDYIGENSVDESEQSEQVSFKRHGKRVKEETTPRQPVQKIDHAVITTDNLTVKILAETIGKSVPELMGKFLLLGMMVNINSNIDFESAELVASEFGITLERRVEKSYEEKLADSFKAVVDAEEELVKRPAVVTVMGHVDHGKTSLLDRIRKTNVVSGEAGGITQSIGAYTININNEDITFIDTPGHAAFTAMRERGAKLTDLAILVVAADDGVMPQTVECIEQIKQTKVPMIVAINKIDVPKANIENVKTQLTKYDVVPEEWGGDAILVPISAKHGQNIDKLLEMVLFVAEYQNLKANPNRKASGSIIEAKLDKGLGAVATVLVQNGTLKVGDYVVVGTCTGKVRAMMNDKLERIKSAGPSTPVQIMGLSGVPNAGDELFVVDEKFSRQVALERQNVAKTQMIKSADLSIENMMNKIADSNFKDYNVIVKADVQGSVEALRQSLSAIQNDEVKVRFVSGGVGAVNENDVSLAQASNAVIIAFNTKTDFKAKVLSDKYKVEIKNSKIIYEVLDFVTEKISKMVTPKYREVVTGHAEIRATFKASKVGLIAGTYVLDGKIQRDSKVRVTHDDKVVYEGTIASLMREKNDAKEVDAGFECGVTFAGFTSFVVGDKFETYALERIN